MKRNNILMVFMGIALFFCGACDKSPGDNGDTGETSFYDVPYADVPAVEDVVMYEANQRVFAATGAFNAITARLDHIKALGVNVIWLMPVNEQGVLKSVGSPYCVKDYKKVEPDYGTLEDLRTLVKQAHNKGMAVIIDWVANHTAWDNVWITAYKSWYEQDASGNVISPVGTNWADVASLNYDNAELRKAMIEAMKYWITEANVDGFRCDAADMVPVSFWTEAITALRTLQTGRKVLLLAEGTNVQNLSAGFDMDYAWDFCTKVAGVYNGTVSLASLYATAQGEYSALPSGKRKLRYITNHDRCAEDGSTVAVYKSERGALSAFVLTICMQGMPLIYSTQEIAYPAGVSFFQPTTVDWNLNPGFYNEYKQLMTVYTASAALKKGRLQTVDQGDVAVLFRLEGTEAVLVAVNVRNTPGTFTLPAQFSGQQFKDMMSGSVSVLPATMEMQPYSYYIWKRE